jgi:hypothetical protein
VRFIQRLFEPIGRFAKNDGSVFLLPRTRKCGSRQAEIAANASFCLKCGAMFQAYSVKSQPVLRENGGSGLQLIL